jgi:hypothetical protein
MKITRSQLKQLIKEELSRVIDEGNDLFAAFDDDVTDSTTSDSIETRITNIPLMATQKVMHAYRESVSGRDASEDLQWLSDNKDEIVWLKDMTSDQILNANSATLRTMMSSAQ